MKIVGSGLKIERAVLYDRNKRVVKPSYSFTSELELDSKKENGRNEDASCDRATARGLPSPSSSFSSVRLDLLRMKSIDGRERP